MSRVAAAALCPEIGVAVVALMACAKTPLADRVGTVAAVMHRINLPGKPVDRRQVVRI